MNKKECHSCDLLHCKNNKRTAGRICCIIDLIKVDLTRQSRPVECGVFCKVRGNKEVVEKYNEFMRFFQSAEKNLPCFEVEVNCNKKGS